MSDVTAEQLLAVDHARDRPDPARPWTFWGFAWGSPVLALVLAVVFVLDEADPAFSRVSFGTWVALGIATLLVLGGELVPIFGGRASDPLGVAWSTPFAFGILLFTDVVLAVVLYAGATVVSGVVKGKAPHRTVFNAGQYALSLFAAEGVLLLMGIRPTVEEPWSPRSLVDLLACLLAGAAFFLVNEVLVSVVLGALDGRPWTAEFTETLRFELAVNGSQLLIGPLVTVVMVHSPLLTALAVVPVAAIHRSATSSAASEWAAGHDHLTGLANRAHFSAVTTRSVRRAVDEPGAGLALFLLDLDRFKEVNDVLGHPIGDLALTEVSTRLQAAVPQAEIVARLGGDEFAFTVRDLTDPAAALDVARSVEEALGRPFHHGSGHLIDLDASIGIAIAPAHGTDVETLFSRADIAMYQAKRDSSGSSVYQEAAGAVPVSRLGIIASLRRALDCGELVLHFQPKVDARTRALAGVEALVRWQHPSGELVPPDEFIPVAEQSGLMPRLTASVVDLALAHCASWRSTGRCVPVAVNVSLRDLLHEGFTQAVATALLHHDVPAGQLTLEITERVLAGDLERVRATMDELHALGVQLSMDDFGTGWASLEMLRQLPVNEVKLDRTFVTRALDSESDLAIVVMVTQLAHALGLTVVAEGVETADVLDRLAALGCDQAQGWHVARPMPADEVPGWVDRHRELNAAATAAAAGPGAT